MLLLLFSAAHAKCESPHADMVPADGSVGVPVDTHVIWITDSDGGEPVLTDASGAEVTSTFAWTESTGNERYGMLAPAALLAPDAAFVVTDGYTTLGFWTGTESGAIAPLAEIASVHVDADSGVVENCDGTQTWVEDSAHVTVTVEPYGVADGWLEARVVDASGGEHLVLGDAAGVTITTGACGRENAGGLMGWDDFDVEIRAVSPSGMPGGWSASESVAIPWPEDCVCGCSAPVAPTGILVLAGVLAVRRRR